MPVMKEVEFRSDELIYVFKQLMALEEWIARYEKYFESRIETLEMTSHNKELIVNMILVKGLFTILKSEASGIYTGLISALKIALK